MTEPSKSSRPPLTLIANSQEWHARSLESILGPAGHAVLRAYTGKQAIERAEAAQPDLIILDTDLPDRDGFDVCRELRANARISAVTPILMTSPGHSSRLKRLEALRAGAWDFIGSALDAEELPLRLGAYVRAKQEVDRMREEGLVDEATGLYNMRGLARRAREIGSQAFRDREPFACIVLTPVSGGALDNAAVTSLSDELATVIRRAGRTSDIIGLLGPGEFAVIAQGTDQTGAVRLTERLAEATAAALAARGFSVAAGYDAVDDFHQSPIEPSDMLMRASIAMHASRAATNGGGMLHISRFEGQVH